METILNKCYEKNSRRLKYYNKIRKEKGIIYVIIKTGNSFLNKTINKTINLCVKIALSGKQLTDAIIFLSQNDFDSNAGALYDYLIDNGYNKKYKIIWLIKNNAPDGLPENVYCYDLYKPSVKKSYYLVRSKYIIYDHGLMKKQRSDQIFCYLTHGSFGLKAVKGHIVLPDDLDYYLAPSEATAPIQAEQFMLEYPNKKQLILGFPKHDVYYDNKPGDLSKLTGDKYNKVILWMPTFRKSLERNDSNVEQPLGLPIFKNTSELDNLNNILNQHDALLIIKIHPAQDLSCVKVNSMSNIKVLNGNTVKTLGIEVNRLMKDVDALISDYSSAAYDYLHIGKPIAYTFDDLQDYKLGLKVSDPQNWIAGPVIYDVNGFKDFISSVIDERDEYAEKRQLLFDKVYTYHDGNSSKRLAEFLGITLDN